MALSNGCISFWDLNNDGTGNLSLVDSTPTGNTLINHNAVPLGSGNNGALFTGNSSQDLTSTVNYNPTSNSLTISFWLQLSQDAFRVVFSDTNSGNTQGLYYNGSFRFDFGGVEIDFGNTADNILHYYTCVANINNSGNVDLYGYLDGSLVVTSLNNSFSDSGVGNWVLGNKSSSYPVYGTLYSFGVWDRALTQSEVSQLYGSGIGYYYPFNTLWYNNAKSDGNWGNLLNWWKDALYTIQATSLPTTSTGVQIYGNVTQNTQGSNQCFCQSASFWSSNFASGLTLQTSGVVNMQGTSIFSGICTDGVSMHDSSKLSSTSIIAGNVVMRDSSRAFGTILSNATVYYDGGNGQFPIGGTVSGTVTYIGWPAASPQWFNDQVSGGGGDGDYYNINNWWANNSYTTRPINPEGQRDLPDSSTDIYIDNNVIYQNTGPNNPTVNSVNASNNAVIANIQITSSNASTFSSGSHLSTGAFFNGNVTFASGGYNADAIVNGTATYTDANGLISSWNSNGLCNLNLGGNYGSYGFQVNISGGGGGTSLGTNWISRLLHLPWFINV